MSCAPSNDFANRRDLFERSKAESCKQKKGKNSSLFLIRLSKELLRVLRGQNTLHGDQLLLFVSSIKPFNSLQNLISSFFPTFSNKLSFRTTANALGARTWIPEEEEAKCQAAAKEETQPTPWSRRRARWHSRELPGKGSTWARGGSSRAPACAPSCCRRRRPWTQMTKVRFGRCGHFFISFYICLF